MNITDEQKELLLKLDIDANVINDVDIILDKLSSYMTNNCFDNLGNPKENLQEIEKLYDQIYNQNSTN